MGTSTSAFGAGKREGHDASDFYARFTAPDISTDDEVAVQPEVDRIFRGDSRDMSAIASNSVALVVTSPPYFAGKEYELALGEGHVPASYLDYLQMLEDVFAECVRTLQPGGRIAINVANLGRKPYRSLSADVITILQDRLRLLMRGEVIWWKGKGASGSCAWGSFKKPSNPVLRDLTERVIIASKGRFDRAVKEQDSDAFPVNESGQALLWADDFMDMTTDLWEIPTESARRVGHPAPFPVELPKRVIELYTYPGDLVLDPFMGAGSTAVAAVRVGRHFVGYDTEPEYVALAEGRIAEERARAEQYRGPVITLPPAPEAGSEDEDPMSRAVREGKKAKDIAKALLLQCGFEEIRDNVKAPGGVVVDFAAIGADGQEWWFDVSGAFTSTRPGLQRTDTLWKAIGRASVVHAAVDPWPRYVLLTTDAPRRNSAGAKALAAVTGVNGPVYDVIELLDPVVGQRLADLARGLTSHPAITGNA